MTKTQLAKIRQLTGLTPEEFGQQIGYSGDTIESLECGRRTILDRHVKIIQKIFRKQLDKVKV